MAKTWTITCTQEPRWNGSGTTTEGFGFFPPEALDHLRQCQAQWPFPQSFVVLKVLDGNATHERYCRSDTVAEIDAQLANQKPAPPVEAVATLDIPALGQILKDDSYRQGPSYYAAMTRLHELAEPLPGMGYFKTGDAAEALAWVKPMTDAEKVACIAYLKAGIPCIFWRGIAMCRVCRKWLGTTCNVTPDGKWRYPAGWEHYVEAHDVRPPDEGFVSDALSWAAGQGLVMLFQLHDIRPRETWHGRDVTMVPTKLIYILTPGKGETLGTLLRMSKTTATPPDESAVVHNAQFDPEFSCGRLPGPKESK